MHTVDEPDMSSDLVKTSWDDTGCGPDCLTCYPHRDPTEVLLQMGYLSPENAMTDSDQGWNTDLHEQREGAKHQARMRRSERAFKRVQRTVED